jgi:2-polyprenyl-3-methyl-5-hydroxy-6-metoxy-1,4-benzoquinol methylase
MSCCGQCAGIEREFNARVAARELSVYRGRGPRGTTKLLIDLLREGPVKGATLLDIGGGIGAIQHELAPTAGRIISVEASSAYLQAQQAEAARRGYSDRAAYLAGDFVALAGSVPNGDIVTLDRVICCYHDMPSLVTLSADRARRLFGAVFPRHTWWNAVGVALLNMVSWLRRSSFRTFLHPPERIDELLRAAGLRQRTVRDTLFWRVAVYTR